MSEGDLYKALYSYIDKITNIENVIRKLMLFAITEKNINFMHVIYSNFFSFN